MKMCSICHGEYEGYGNNAIPVNRGRCCDHCDCFIVIPTRLARMTGRAIGDYQDLAASLLEMRKNPPELIDRSKQQTGDTQK